MTWHVHAGDCLPILAAMGEGSVDAICTDPPAGIAFMGREWDKDKGGRDNWIAWMQTIATEALRVAKPGAHALVWALPRTSHWTATAWENAGWQVRDVVCHLFGSGFPKSLAIGKAIDAAKGAEREVVGTWSMPGRGSRSLEQKYGLTQDAGNITAPATPEAAQWEGWGTALKPAAEHWLLLRKPPVGTIAENVLAHGTGGINVDGCRVGFASPGDEAETKGKNRHGDFGSEPRGTRGIYGADNREQENCAAAGRYPSNLILDDSDEVRAAFARQGAGEAVRFFYTSKASRKERDDGVEGEHVSAAEITGRKPNSPGLKNPRASCTSGGRNVHPTVKSLELMRYLVRMVTPPGGTVLDCFTGSGSTGCAAITEGFNFIGIELNPEYAEIARQRIGQATQRERFSLGLKPRRREPELMPG